MKLFCDNCSYETRTINKTLYGEYLCDECWYDYLCTDRGRVEYFVGIAVGDYTAGEFDAEFLGEMIIQWYKHKHLFKISESLISIYENAFFELLKVQTTLIKFMLNFSKKGVYKIPFL